MILLNGRGQLGEALKKELHLQQIDKPNICIYHTWNFMDKSEETQKNELAKLEDYVNNRHKKEDKLVFISTMSSDCNPYVIAKEEAEYLVDKTLPNFLVVRLPNLIGKGLFNRIKEQDITRYSDCIKFMSVRNAAKFVIESALSTSDNPYVWPEDGSKASTSDLLAIYEHAKQ